MTSLNIKKYIQVKYEFIGYHKWSNAPEEVGFLRNEHRHMFHVEIEFEVNHNDRDLEFYLMRDKIKNAIGILYHPHPQWLKGYLVESCEQVAEDLVSYFEEKGYNMKCVRVSEDGDNGSVIYLS